MSLIHLSIWSWSIWAGGQSGQSDIAASPDLQTCRPLMIPDSTALSVRPAVWKSHRKQSFRGVKVFPAADRLSESPKLPGFLGRVGKPGGVAD